MNYIGFYLSYHTKITLESQFWCEKAAILPNKEDVVMGLGVIT